MAISDPSAKLASPLTIVKREEDLADIEAIAHIINQYDVKQVIVGLPRAMDGSLGRQAEKVEAFTQQMRRYIKVPAEFRDERLTTVSAKRFMRETQTKKSKKKRDDAIAAAVILQGFLDEEHI